MDRFYGQVTGMNRRDVVAGLREASSLAKERGQIEAAREIDALRTQIASQFYFQVDEGGFANLIPDKEYEEFDDKQAVVDYVLGKLYVKGAGYSSEEINEIRQNMDFESARSALMEIGEFGEMGQPTLPPDALVGTRENDSAFYKEIPVQLPPLEDEDEEQE